MSAIPSNLYTAPKVSGLKSIKTTSISLRPVNASSTSEFSYDGNRKFLPMPIIISAVSKHS